MNKKMILLIIGLLVIASPVKSNWSKTDKMAAAVGIGAAASFLFWLGRTSQKIDEQGIVAAIRSTHIPRLALDVATIGLVVAYFNKK